VQMCGMIERRAIIFASRSKRWRISASSEKR
jgi:hypothetical protein